MSLYRLLSALLCYPEQELLDALTEVEGALAAYPEAEETLQPLIGHLASQDLIDPASAVPTSSASVPASAPPASPPSDTP